MDLDTTMAQRASTKDRASWDTDKGSRLYRVLSRHSRDSCRWGLSGLAVGARQRRTDGGRCSFGAGFGDLEFLAVFVSVPVGAMAQAQEQASCTPTQSAYYPSNPEQVPQQP